jgi:glycosyltransferase involved in cell wall biosynthesis
MISIIVPIYNNEINLKEYLDSILSQTFTNWEAILVNDGSTDNTGKIIDEYAKKDSRFIAIHKQNEGTLLARKSGFENSKGNFIANIAVIFASGPGCIMWIKKQFISVFARNYKMRKK